MPDTDTDDTTTTLRGDFDAVLARFVLIGAVVAKDWAIVQAQLLSPLSSAPPSGSLTLSADDVADMKAGIANFGSLADQFQLMANGMVPPATITAPVSGDTMTATTTDGAHATAVAAVNGDPSAQGPQGAQGADDGGGGQTGATGQTGPTGGTGQTGAMGQTGATGGLGASGPVGGEDTSLGQNVDDPNAETGAGETNLGDGGATAEDDAGDSGKSGGAAPGKKSSRPSTATP